MPMLNDFKYFWYEILDQMVAIIFVDKDHVIEFYKAGQLIPGEQEQILQLLRKYEK